MDVKETIEFTRIVSALGKLYPRLPNYAATVAVNYFKQRFVVQRDIFEKPLQKRKNNVDPGRAILVGKGSGRFKRDIQKIRVTDTYAIVGTTKISAPYAKAHNEGFKGTVTVRQFTRRRYKHVKEKYTDKKGQSRSRTSKQVDTSTQPIIVGTFKRKMNLPKRQVMGVSPFVDRRIQAEVTRQIIYTIKTNSSYGQTN